MKGGNMNIGNASDVEQALRSRNPENFLDALHFFERLEDRRKNESSEIRKHFLAKKLLIWQEALKICPPGEKIKFFGSQKEILKTIAEYEKEISNGG
jgi:hypothetical protein